VGQQTVGTPQVTVLMAVYNGARYLPEAIDSVLAQTLRDFELIIVDDASDDHTPTILAAYASRDERVRVVRNDSNIGAYPSANRGLGLARAPLVARLDADDTSEPGRLAAQVAFLERHPSCLLVGSGYRSIDAAGRLRFVRHNPLGFELAAFVARLRMPMVHPSFCFRRTMADGSPVLYDTERPIAGDYALAARLSRHGPIASLSEPLVRYRMHAANISSTRRDRQNHFAHAVATAAVGQHYPPGIAADLIEWLAVSYGLSPPTPQRLHNSLRGFDAAIDHDFGTRAPLAVRERAAGMITEAYFSQELSLALLAALVRHGARHVFPLALRSARVKGWLGPLKGPA
jgi:glycosyltransferase involved in cell wall biosynthesis